MPAETAGIVRAPEKWNGDSLASMSIGYEIGVSALQMATAFATIANNGVRIQSHIIKEIRQSDEQIVPAAQPDQRQVVSAETARDMRKMLREVVVSGTARRAQLNGYTSAGKTGTAWKFDEKLKRVNSAKYVSSFIGFAPAENPAVTIAVVMDEPKVGGRDGGQVAGPVFKDIAQQILPELNVKPEGYITEEPPVDNIREAPAGGPSASSLNEAAPSTGGNYKVAMVIPKAPVKKEARPESSETNPAAVKKTEKTKPVEKNVKAKSASPRKWETDAKPNAQIKNKSSTEKKKGKT